MKLPFRRAGVTDIEPQTRDAALAEAFVEADIARTMFGNANSAGVYVTDARVAGLPAVTRAISMISNDVAKMPLQTFSNTADGVTWSLDADVWQQPLLTKPNSEFSGYEFWRNATVSLVGHSNLFIEKVMGVGRFRTQVVELHILDPNKMSVRRTDSGDIQYRFNNGDWMPSNRIIHVRDISFDPSALVAPSKIAIHKETFGRQLAAERYIGSFYANDGTPQGIISFPEGMTETQMREYLSVYNAQHKGVNNSHKTGVMSGGATYLKMGISPADADYVQTAGLNKDDVANIFGVPATRLDAHFNARVNPSDDDRYWETVNVYMALIEAGLTCDADLFPTLGGVKPKFHFDALLRVTPVQRSQIFTQARQGGWLSINEIRAIEGYPPIDGAVGDVYHPIPAGAGPDGMGNGNPAVPPVDPNADLNTQDN